jgi:arylsulfatase A
MHTIRNLITSTSLFFLLSAYSADNKKLDINKPNLVIFFTDDQGTLDVNCYGSKDLYTPNMDKLAEDGVRFTQAYAHQVCCPARAMLMTGRHPQRSNVNHWTQGDAKGPKTRNMNLEEYTLAEALKDSGYKTALFGKWHLGAHLDYGPTKQGFDEFYGIRGGFIDNYNHYFLHGEGFHDLYEGTKEVFDEGKYFPNLVTDRALNFIDRNKNNPFFLFLAFNIPHYPEQADPKFDERYKNMKMPRQSYAKMISTTDDHMGQIMSKLQEHGIYDNTIIIFMSDNGHSRERNHIKFDNHKSGLAKNTKYGALGGGGNTGKWRGNKSNFYEGGIRVPAIITFPNKLPKGAVRDQAITAMDWMPTVLELCNIEPPKIKFDGKSLTQVIASEDNPSPHKVLNWQWHLAWAIRQGSWKLMGRGTEPTFLGNLDDKQPEKTNYLTEKPELVKTLHQLHKQWALDVGAPQRRKK